MIFNWLRERRVSNLIRNINDVNSCLNHLSLLEYNSEFEDHLRTYRNCLMRDLKSKLAKIYIKRNGKGIDAIDCIKEEHLYDFD